MTDEFIEEIRKIESLNTAILSSVTLFKNERKVEVKLTTDKSFSSADEAQAKKIVADFVPDFFSSSLKISKLTPDEEMVAKKIYSLVATINSQLAAFITPADIKVNKIDGGFSFEITVVRSSMYTADFAGNIAAELKKCFCGNFIGACKASAQKLDDIKVEEEQENVEYEIPIRTFEIADFAFLEGTETQKTAVYIADLNFVSENVVVCGNILSIHEKMINSRGKEKPMYTLQVSDGTAAMRFTYFSKQKTLDKIKKLQVGDSVVLTCRTEFYNSYIRATANFIDYGRLPDNFVPVKRKSKPVPKFYKTINPQPYSDFTQDTLFTDTTLPACLTENTFVVFDLETTGLHSSPSAGNMDRIIEIGAYKIIGGEIKQSFSTFVNPKRKLSAEIIDLTGIEQHVVDAAPDYEKVMPDFFKFISGSYLVGHNAANFDYKFIEYYCSACGYEPERKIFDTLPFSQKTLHLSNYKLNTVADYFGIKFNHHRASDDALVTAKIFIELVKLKKSLPDLC